ncbi:hypothetical protein J437_LFUL012662, partial [Ladona fulva]
MELENLISSFQLETLDDGWVESVWENEFMELEELPTEYLSSEEFDMVVQDFKVEIKNVILSCSAENNESLRIWDILGQHTKRLLPVIYYFINQGKVDSENDESRSACLSAASLYFLLLSIPGSSAYRVFRTLLFENALDCFKLSSLLKEESTGKKRIQDEDYDEGDNEGLFYGQKYQLAEGLNSALLDLLSLLKIFSLKDKQTSFELVVQTLTSLTQVDNKISKLNFAWSHASKYNLPTHRNLDDLLHSLSYNAFVALYLLSRGRLHESDVACVEMVLDNLLPGLAWGGSLGTARERTIMRHNVLAFVRNCLLPIAKEQDELEGTVLTLVRHLCGAVVRMATDVRRLVKELQDSMPNIIIALVERFKDVSPTVCGKALSAVSECASLPSIIDIICSSFDRELE